MSTRPRRQSDDYTLAGQLTAGTRAVPSVRSATACVGVAAAVALVLRSTPSVSVAVFGSTVMLAAMVLLALVSRVATEHDPRLNESLRRPAIALAWAVVGASIVVLALLITTTFWGVPHYYRALPAQLGPTCYRGTGLGRCEPDAPTKSGTQTS